MKRAGKELVQWKFYEKLNFHICWYQSIQSGRHKKRIIIIRISTPSDFFLKPGECFMNCHLCLCFLHLSIVLNHNNIVVKLASRIVSNWTIIICLKCPRQMCAIKSQVRAINWKKYPGSIFYILIAVITGTQISVLLTKPSRCLGSVHVIRA